MDIDDITTTTTRFIDFSSSRG